MRPHFSSKESTKTAVQMSDKAGTASRQSQPALLPTALAEVALVDAPTAAAAGSMSVSWWHAEVAAGRAPAPAIRAPRCTRWRLVDVRGFWQTFGEQTDASAAAAVKAQATKASAVARSRRRTAANGTLRVEA